MRFLQAIASPFVVIAITFALACVALWILLFPHGDFAQHVLDDHTTHD